MAAVMTSPTMGSARGNPAATPIAPATTASDVNPSVRACRPSATGAAEPIFRPTPGTNRPTWAAYEPCVARATQRYQRAESERDDEQGGVQRKCGYRHDEGRASRDAGEVARSMTFVKVVVGIVNLQLKFDEISQGMSEPRRHQFVPDLATLAGCPDESAAAEAHQMVRHVGAANAEFVGEIGRVTGTVQQRQQDPAPGGIS